MIYSVSVRHHRELTFSFFLLLHSPLNLSSLPSFPKAFTHLSALAQLLGGFHVESPGFSRFLSPVSRFFLQIIGANTRAQFPACCPKRSRPSVRRGCCCSRCFQLECCLQRRRTGEMKIDKIRLAAVRIPKSFRGNKTQLFSGHVRSCLPSKPH